MSRSSFKAVACSPVSLVIWQLRYQMQKSFENATVNGHRRTMEKALTSVAWLGSWMMKWAGLTDCSLIYHPSLRTRSAQTANSNTPLPVSTVEHDPVNLEWACRSRVLFGQSTINALGYGNIVQQTATASRNNRLVRILTDGGADERKAMIVARWNTPTAYLMFCSDCYHCKK